MAPRNGFYHFKTIKAREPEMRNLSEAEVMAACDRLWRNMTEEQKAAYSRGRGAPITFGDAVASRGGSITATLERKRREEAEEMEKRLEEVTDMVEGFPWLESSADLKIIIMEMSFWVVGDLGNDILEAVPAEIALVEMSIKSGVQRYLIANYLIVTII
jgi:hypothetical protein